MNEKQIKELIEDIIQAAESREIRSMRELYSHDSVAYKNQATGLREAAAMLQEKMILCDTKGVSL